MRDKLRRAAGRRFASVAALALTLITAPAAPAQPDRIAELRQLGELHAQGVLTDEEFAAEKAKILGS